MRFIAFILIVAIAGGAGYWYWTTTPQYSIEQVKEAVKSHDLQKFNKYVDVDTASSRMVDDFLTKPMRETLGPSVIGQVIVSGVMGLFKPHLARGVKQEIVSFVETGSFRQKDSASETGGPHTVSLSAADDHLGFHKHALKSIASTTITGNTAELELLFHNEKFNQDLPLDVTMRKMDGYWQVTELSNFPAFCGKLAQLEADRQMNNSQPSTADDTQPTNHI
jgi:hypothetical protein